MVRMLPFHQGFSIFTLYTFRPPVVEGRPVYYRKFSSIPSLYPLGANRLISLRTTQLPTPQLWIQKISPDTAKCPLEDKTAHPVENHCVRCSALMQRLGTAM